MYLFFDGNENNTFFGGRSELVQVVLKASYSIFFDKNGIFKFNQLILKPFVNFITSANQRIVRAFLST